MTRTMAEAQMQLRAIGLEILTSRNTESELCLSPEDIAKGAVVLSDDENMVRLVALGGMGTMLYEALTEWLLTYEKTRQRWLSETPSGRRCLQDRAPATFARVMAARRARKQNIKAARRARGHQPRFNA